MPSRGENRFYHPPAVRDRLLRQQRQHQQQPATRTNGSLCARNNSSSSVSCASSVKSEATATYSTRSKDSVEGQSGDGRNLTNLDRFLDNITPRVSAQYLPKRSMRDWRTREAEVHPYFVLGDLWDSFREWSVYGAGVPLLLNGSDSVVQYYVPYLSGIQLYIDPSKPLPRLRTPGEDSDKDSSRETSSDNSSDYGAERDHRCIVNNWSQQNVSDSNTLGLNGLSLGNPSMSSSSDESETGSTQGHLVFEYMEYNPPYSREPLADKMLVLASQFPELRTYRSCDLSPSSWVSVAWYPIYRIPTGPTLQNLDACFLTFHSLSTGSNAGTSTERLHNTASSIRDGHNDEFKMPLPIFGLAFYKFRVSFWSSDAVNECQKANSLLRAADTRLKLLQVHHPDFNFFASRNTYWR